MRLGHHFQGKKVKSQLAGAGAYCEFVTPSRTACIYLS